MPRTATGNYKNFVNPIYRSAHPESKGLFFLTIDNTGIRVYNLEEQTLSTPLSANDLVWL